MSSQKHDAYQSSMERLRERIAEAKEAVAAESAPERTVYNATDREAVVSRLNTPRSDEILAGLNPA